MGLTMHKRRKQKPCCTCPHFPILPLFSCCSIAYMCAVYVRVYVILVVAKMPWWLFLVYHQVTPSPRPQLKTLDRFHFYPSSTVKCTMHMLHWFFSVVNTPGNKSMMMTMCVPLKIKAYCGLPLAAFGEKASLVKKKSCILMILTFPSPLLILPY